jgi:hypothetical protein
MPDHENLPGVAEQAKSSSTSDDEMMATEDRERAPFFRRPNFLFNLPEVSSEVFIPVF